MAGCSNSRCSSERRSLRRELDHWRKDLITCVGLESFAEFLMGPERFKEVMPFNGFEAVDCPDWELSSECRLCHARREVVTESLEHHKELIERQRTLEETSSQDFPGSYVPFKFSSAQEAIRHLASHHASKQQQSSQSALQEDSDKLDSDEDDLLPSPQHNSCNGTSARRLRNSPYFLKIPRVPFGHEAQEKVSHGHINDGAEVGRPTAEHFSIPAATMKTTADSTSSAQHCSETNPLPQQGKSHSVCHSSKYQALGKCQSFDNNVSANGNILPQSPIRANDSNTVPIEVTNHNSNAYNDTRCLDEDFLLWVIYSKRRKGRHLFSFEDLEMNCYSSNNEVAGSVTEGVSQDKTAVLPTTTAQDTNVHNPPTSADDKVQATPSQHASTIFQLTSNLKKCPKSSLPDMAMGGPWSDMIRNECNVEACKVGAINDEIGNMGRMINDSDVNFHVDKDCVDVYPSYLFKPIGLSSDAASGPLPSDKTRNKQDSDTLSCYSISPPSLSPVTERDHSSVYSLEQDEDNNDSDDPPPPILSPMPTMYWATAFCPALRKESQGNIFGDKDVNKAEIDSMGRDAGLKSFVSSKSSQASVNSKENSSDYYCPPEGSCSGISKIDHVHDDNVPHPSITKTLSNSLCKGLPTNNQENLCGIYTDIKTAGSSENTRKQAFSRKCLTTEHCPQHAPKRRHLHCLPHRPLTGFAKFENKCKDETRHVGMGHYLLNRSSTQEASESDLQLQKARILPCHVRLRKLSSRQIPQHGVHKKKVADRLPCRRTGRPRKWMWVKGKSGKMVRVLIPKKESVPSGVGDIEVLKKLRPSAKRVVRQAQLKTDHVLPGKKDGNVATCKALRPLPVRLAKVNDDKFQSTPRRQCKHKGSHQSMQPKTRDKAKPVPVINSTCPDVKQRCTSIDGNEDDNWFDVKWTVSTVCSCKTAQSTDLPCTCTFVTASLDTGCKVENHVLSTKKTAALASLSAPPKFVRKQTRGNSQVEEKDDEGKNVMKLGIRTLPHRRARTKVLKAFHTVVLKKYQKPESFMPAAIRRLRLLPSRHKRLRESTKSMPCLSKKSRKHLLVTLQKTTDCKISQKHCPTRDLRIGPNCPTDSNKDDGNKPTPIKHTKLILQDGTDRQYDCKGAEEPMQVEQRSIVLHPRSPPTASAGVSGIQHSCPNESEVNMTRIDMPVVKRELDQPMTKSVVEVYEKRQLRVLPERVARLREEERKQQAENTVTMTRASPSLKKLIDCQNNSAFDKDAETEDMETKSLSIEIAEKPVVLNDSKSNSEYSKHLVSEGISGRMSHTCNNVQVETRTQYTSCKIEVEDDERKLRSLPCRMVAQSNNSQEMPKARKRPRKHSPLSSDAEFMANVHQGRPRNYVLSESLNNTIYTKKHAKHVMETVSAELKSGSICVDQAMKLDHGSLETANNNQPNLVKSSHPNEVTSDRELDTAIALSSNQEENSKTEIDTTDMEAAASTCDILVKRKVTRCPKTDLRYNCMSLNTSLTLQYKDAIISNGWVKTSEKPGTGSGDGSLIQSLFTQPVTYDTVMRLVGVGSSKTRLCQSREQVALTQVTPSPQCEKYIHTQHNSTKCSKTKKKGFEEVSMTKDLAEAVPISPSKPIMNPSTTLRATKQQKTPKTKIDRQADRLRKTLRKFATMTPAKNRIIPYEDVGRRKCKAAKKLFVVQSNPSILWCHHPSSDSKTKGPKPKLSSNAVSLSGAKDNSNLNAQQGAKGRIENSSHTSSTTVSASSSDGLCRERGNLTVSPENVKISQGKKTLKKCSILPSFTSTGHDLGKAKPEKASNKKHKVDPVQAIEKSDHRDECPSNTAQASRSSVRIQKKRLLGFSICPCCALVEAEHFKRFNKRVKITKSNEKHQTEKVDSPAKHRKQLQVAKNANEVSVSASQLDKPFNLVSKTKAKNKLATKEKIQKSNKDRGSPRRYVNSSSDFPPVTSTSSKAVDSDVPEDLSYHVPQLGRSTSSPLISSTEQTVLSQWDTPTHGEKIPKEYPGVKDQVTYPEVNALVQNGKVFSECEDVFSSPCEKNELLDEERFVGPLDLRVSWKKDEPC
ncbi:uncharacterized protein LOC118413288 isoform X1 [Branchiostoma floridae]|uniref:Uncharacterized protein LOC118413288 isoform X1 n=1 Tax=Branchiostoma floridae TaxID=7739 RepID=A0A9J7MLS8_BRAFL|nr:uncharacterized protein LOC118413288 isoform X1 [Branchiostoma floridae]